MRGIPGVGLLAIALVACGGSEVSSASPRDGGSDGAADDAPVGADSAPSDAPTDAPVYLACMDSSGQLDGALKRCQSDAECVIKHHTTSCCGSVTYVGIASASVSPFVTCETAWGAHFPACECASGAPKTEDGKSLGIGADAGTPQVHCIDFTSNGGICQTFLP
jgi:hypothetical protein